MPSRPNSPQGDAHALPAPTRERNEDADDDLDDDLDLPLPGAGEDEEPVGGDDHDDDADAIDELDDDGASPLDDAEATDLDAGDDEIDETDDEDEGEGEVDVGPLDDEVDIGEENELGDESASNATNDEDGLDLEEHAADDDGGAEGTSEAPEDAVDESALPELAADDDADDSDEDLAEVLLADAQLEPVPWDATRWTQLEGAGAAVPCAALAIAAGRVAAAGEVLLLVREGERAARQPAFGAGVVAVAAADDLLFTATARGQIAVSQGAWDEATSLGALRAGHGLVELAATPGRGWVRCEGALHAIAPPYAALSPVRERGVLAMSASGGAVLVLTAGAPTPGIERRRGDDEGPRETPLRGAARRLVEGVEKQGTITLTAAAGGRLLAFTDGARIAVSRDAGATFSVGAFGVVLALAFAGDDDGAALLILTEGGAVVQSPAHGEATRVAAIEGLGGAPAALGWDATRECAWIACRAGLLAFGRAPRH
jgi:hypothetical protein